MSGYGIALFTHLLSLLLAVAGASLTSFAALRLRTSGTAEEAMQWLALNARLVRVFPFASAGLVASGAYMVQSLQGWSEPWVLSSLAGLAAIIGLGAGIEGSRARLLKRELARAGLSSQARRLKRDPFAWSAKLTTLTLIVAVVFIMTDKPSIGICAASLIAALVIGVVGAVPLWRAPAIAKA